MLHDEKGQYVQIDECPFYGINYTLEQFIHKVYADKVDGHNHLGIPFSQYPEWLSEGVNLFRHIKAVEEKIHADVRKASTQ